MEILYTETSSLRTLKTIRRNLNEILCSGIRLQVNLIKLSKFLSVSVISTTPVHCPDMYIVQCACAYMHNAASKNIRISANRCPIRFGLIFGLSYLVSSMLRTVYVAKSRIPSKGVMFSLDWSCTITCHNFIGLTGLIQSFVQKF